MTETKTFKADGGGLLAHRIEVQFAVLCKLALISSSGAALAMLFYFLFELFTEHAFSLMQPAIYVPALGPRTTEWLLMSGFSMIFVGASYVSSLVLPPTMLVRRFISNQLALYVIYFGLLLLGVYLTIPDLLLKKELFLRLVTPAMIAPEDFLLFLIVPLVPVFFEYRKRNIQLWSNADLVRIAVGICAWIGVVLILTTLP